MTKKEAREILNANKENTGYFPTEKKEAYSIESMYEMLRYRMRFGESETQVILASLVLAGAKFK